MGVRRCPSTECPASCARPDRWRKTVSSWALGVTPRLPAVTPTEPLQHPADPTMWTTELTRGVTEPSAGTLITQSASGLTRTNRVDKWRYLDYLFPSEFRGDRDFHSKSFFNSFYTVI